jgi:hypothetical protein
MILFKKKKLIKAIADKDAAAVKRLLEAGAPAKAYHRQHPLFLYAVAAQNAEVAGLLLDKGADLRAACANHGNLVDVLAEKKMDVDFLSFLLEREPGIITMRDLYGGKTLLHYAAAAGHADVAAFLLAKGSDPAAKDNANFTAYDYAMKNGYAPAMKLLAPPAEPVVDTAPAWHRLSGDRVAEVTVDAVIGYKLTDIFNFETRERLSISRNLATDAETRETKSFDDIPDKTVLERAFAAYAQSGGAIVKDVVLGKSLSKAALRPGV